MHAYMIMAHNNFNQLKLLCELLDDYRNILFIHIDKKSGDISELKKELGHIVLQSDIYFTKRINVKWGGTSQVDAEFLLLEEATKYGCEYYHLLSGLDLPLKSQDYIHNFFKQNKGKNFIHFCDRNFIARNTDRYRYFWLFQEYVGRRKSVLEKCFSKVNSFSIMLQKIIGIDRRKSEIVYANGSQWYSITHELASNMVADKNIIYKQIKWTSIPDEMFIQTYVLNSKSKNTLYRCNFDNNYVSSMRFIDWERGNPYTFTIQDYNQLENSPYLFARKFDENQDENIINKIKEKLKGLKYVNISNYSNL